MRLQSKGLQLRSHSTTTAQVTVLHTGVVISFRCGTDKKPFVRNVFETGRSKRHVRGEVKVHPQDLLNAKRLAATAITSYRARFMSRISRMPRKQLPHQLALNF